MIIRIIKYFVLSVLAHRGRWAIAALAFMALCALTATRLKLADDARALVAEGDTGVTQQLEALSQFTTVDQMLLQLDSQGHPEELEAAARLTADHLIASGAFTNARFEVEPTRQLELVDTLLPRRFVLDPRPPAELVTPEALAARLASVRETMLAPQGLVQKSYLLRDPLGSMAAALSGVATTPGLSKLDTSSGRFFSQDGNSLLLIATPKGNPFGGTEAARSMAAIEEAAKTIAPSSPHVVLRPIGAHRFTNDAQQLVKNDVNFSVTSSLAGVLIIFVLFFLRPNLIVVAVPPMAFGAAFAAAIAALLGDPVHPIVLAFAAACLGLSTDATIHLVSTTATCGRVTREALPIAARRIGPSLSLVMTTTVAGLLALCFAHVGALKQMGVLSAAAVLGAFIGTLVWVPIMLPLVAKRTPQPPFLRGPWTWAVDFATRRPRLIVGIAIVVAIVSVAFARTGRVDGDLRNLDTHTASGRADEAAFAAAFGDPNGAALALIERPTLEEALADTERVAVGLREAHIPRVLSPTVLAPPLAIASARRQAWCAVRGDLTDRLAVAAENAGFRPNAFAPFTANLEALCGPGGEALLDPRPAVALFEHLLDRPVVRDAPGGGVRIALAFEADDAGMAAARKIIADRGNTVMIHRTALNEQIVRVVAADLPRLAGISLVLVALLLVLSFRDLRHPARALAPCVLAIFATLGVLAATDTPINLMNLVVFPLLAGVGIDYGVLMADADRDPDPGALHDRAFSLTVAAVTTLTDFGSFALADYYALATIGRSVLLAVFASAFFALFLSPALGALGRKKGTEDAAHASARAA